MDSDTLFMLAIAGFYLLRKVLSVQKSAKTRQQQSAAPTSQLPGTPQPVPVSEPIARKTQPEFVDALNEIRTALGMQSYSKEKPAFEPEPFADWDEEFERRGSTRSESSDRGQKKPVRVFSDDNFHTRSPMPESDFHDHWKENQTQFGFQALPEHDHTSERAAPEKPLTPYLAAPRSINQHVGLIGAENLRETIVLSEILGPPLSRRIQSARRRLS
jgi:hypothetical protein